MMHGQQNEKNPIFLSFYFLLFCCILFFLSYYFLMPLCIFAGLDSTSPVCGMWKS